MLRLTPELLARKDPTALQQFGRLFETFAVWEIIEQSSGLDQRPDTGHYRTRDGIEVDLVLDADDGRVTAFECKASGCVSKEDFAGLRSLRDALGDRFNAGVVLYTGTRGYTYDDRLHVQPLDRLWTPLT